MHTYKVEDNNTTSRSAVKSLVRRKTLGIEDVGIGTALRVIFTRM